MLIRDKELENIIKGLTLVHFYVRARTKLEKFDVNIECEYLFCGLLNLLSRVHLKNLNNEKRKYPAIDLGDKEKGLAVQVTSSTGWGKISETIESFEKYKQYNHFDTLLVLIIGEKEKYKKQKGLTKERFGLRLETQNYTLLIKDIYDLIDEIGALDNTQRIKGISTYINNNIDTTLNSLAQKTYEFQQDSLKMFNNANRFLKYLNVDKSMVNKEQQDLKNFAEYMRTFTREIRSLIFEIISIKIKDSRDSVYFDFYKLKSRFQISHQEQLYEDLDILINDGLIDKETGFYGNGSSQYWELDYSDYEGNIFYFLADYCNSNDKSLKEIIINLDFSLLD